MPIVELYNPDNQCIASDEGGCFGFLGRGDYYVPLEETPYDPHEYSDRYDESIGHNNSEETISFLRIRPDKDHSVEMSLDWFDLVCSIPEFKRCIRSTRKQFIEEGIVDVDSYRVGADATVNTLMVLAAEARYRCRHLVEATKFSTVPPFIRMLFCLGYARGTQFSLDCGDGTLFYGMRRMDVIDFITGVMKPRECSLSYDEMRIYPMTILYRWVGEELGPDIYDEGSPYDFDFLTTLQDTLWRTKYNPGVIEEVNGYFGTFTATYIKFPMSALSNFYQQILRGED